MGRRPNPLIGQWFERGPKLNDSSNRYPHTCKACGECFPKGRIDSLTTHLTKKCPAISEADRIDACLSLHGIDPLMSRSPRQRVARLQKAKEGDATGAPAGATMASRDWSALETLAEVSRQIDMNEKHDDRVLSHVAAHPGQPGPSGSTTDAAERQLVSLELLPLISEGNQLGDRQDGSIAQTANRGRTDETKVTSVAATSAAQLHPSLLDPELLGDSPNTFENEKSEVVASAQSAEPSQTREPTATVLPAQSPRLSPLTPNEELAANPMASAQPWGEITNSASPAEPTITGLAGTAQDTSSNVDSAGRPQASPPGPSPTAAQPAMDMAHMGNPFTHGSKGPTLAPIVSFPPPTHNTLTFRVEVDGNNGSKARHTRARFDATRRKEVQEVRKVGACIRCKILRKTCSLGQPCDACRKVLSPRIWRSGCIRTKLHEELTLYSAGVQIVLAQQRVNTIKSSVSQRPGSFLVDARHFAGGPHMSLKIMQLDQDGVDITNKQALTMLCQDTQDIPVRIETYMRSQLARFIESESSTFAQRTLQVAADLNCDSHDEILEKALELWGYVEILDRERQWSIGFKPRLEEDEVVSINEATYPEAFDVICLQLAAATERKAGTVSRALLSAMQRVLQDSKVRIGVTMYFAALILLICVEKTTWNFKAWEEQKLRPLWPLEKEPESFTQQGFAIADLLRMLLVIRKALPEMVAREEDGMLTARDVDSVLTAYFKDVALPFHYVKAKKEHPAFVATNPRSLELLFCSTLLLPGNVYQ